MSRIDRAEAGRAVRLAILLGSLIMSSAAAQDGIIRNGTAWHDTEGREIWSNGGHMIREGDTFYWVGYETARGRPWRIHLYSSRNLADWRFEKTLIRPEGEFAQFGWAGRPALLHNRAAGKYVIVFEASAPGWERHKVGFAVADRIDGDYRLANMEYPDGRSTGDQSVYQEGDEAYVLATLDTVIDGRRYRNQSISIYRLRPDFLGIERKVFEGFDNVNGDPNVRPREHSGREAAHIIKVDGRYYWFHSGLVGWNSSATMYAVATDLAGPWSPLRTLETVPPSEDSFNTQHDFIIPVVGREGTTYVYVGDRYSQWTGKGTGRNIFLPLEWHDGAPRLRWVDQWRLDVANGTFEVIDAAPEAP